MSSIASPGAPLATVADSNTVHDPSEIFRRLAFITVEDDDEDDGAGGVGDREDDDDDDDGRGSIIEVELPVVPLAVVRRGPGRPVPSATSPTTDQRSAAADVDDASGASTPRVLADAPASLACGCAPPGPRTPAVRCAKHATTPPLRPRHHTDAPSACGSSRRRRKRSSTVVSTASTASTSSAYSVSSSSTSASTSGSSPSPSPSHPSSKPLSRRHSTRGSILASSHASLLRAPPPAAPTTSILSPPAHAQRWRRRPASAPTPGTADGAGGSFLTDLALPSRLGFRSAPNDGAAGARASEKSTAAAAAAAASKAQGHHEGGDHDDGEEEEGACSCCGDEATTTTKSGVDELWDAWWSGALGLVVGDAPEGIAEEDDEDGRGADAESSVVELTVAATSATAAPAAAVEVAEVQGSEPVAPVVDDVAPTSTPPTSTSVAGDRTERTPEPAAIATRDDATVPAKVTAADVPERKASMIPVDATAPVASRDEAVDSDDVFATYCAVEHYLSLHAYPDLGHDHDAWAPLDVKRNKRASPPTETTPAPATSSSSSSSSSSTPPPRPPRRRPLSNSVSSTSSSSSSSSSCAAPSLSFSMTTAASSPASRRGSASSSSVHRDGGTSHGDEAASPDPLSLPPTPTSPTPGPLANDFAAAAAAAACVSPTKSPSPPTSSPTSPSSWWRAPKMALGLAATKKRFRGGAPAVATPSTSSPTPPSSSASPLAAR